MSDFCGIKVVVIICNTGTYSRYDLEITACNVQCVSLDSVFSYAELWVCQQVVDQSTDITADELWQRSQLFVAKLQDTDHFHASLLIVKASPLTPWHGSAA